MSLTKYFDKEIQPAVRKLDDLRGTKTIEVKEYSKEQRVGVTRYVAAINTAGRKVFIEDIKMRNAETLGLSLERVR